MNWRRGIFRLWAVASVIWIVVSVWLRHQLEASILDMPLGFRLERGLMDWRFWAEEVLLPPIATAAAGLIVCWIANGFRKSN